MMHADVRDDLNALSSVVVDALIEVHRHLGPGLLESLYKEALAHELQRRGLHVRREVPVPLVYKEVVLGRGLRLDLLVEDKLVIEAKSVLELAPVHFAQLDSYLRLSALPIGFLVNFHAPVLKGNIHRRVGPAARRTLSPS